MKMADWDKEAATMTMEELRKQKAALDTLATWEAFKREYGWTGFSIVGQILGYEIERRKGGESNDR